MAVESRKEKNMKYVHPFSGTLVGVVGAELVTVRQFCEKETKQIERKRLEPPQQCYKDMKHKNIQHINDMYKEHSLISLHFKGTDILSDHSDSPLLPVLSRYFLRMRTNGSH